MIDAGEFSIWLSDFRHSLLSHTPMDVPCGNCNACCISSMFVQIDDSETDTLCQISQDLFIKNAAGAKILGHDHSGRCVMYSGEFCTIYKYRPLACRQFDCRIYAASGLNPIAQSKDKISQQVRQWSFSYDSNESRQKHQAVKRTAQFIQDFPEHFPGGRTPTEAIQIALVTIKSYKAILQGTSDSKLVAKKIVQMNEDFEKRRAASC